MFSPSMEVKTLGSVRDGADGVGHGPGAVQRPGTGADIVPVAYNLACHEPLPKLCESA